MGYCVYKRAIDAPVIGIDPGWESGGVCCLAEDGMLLGLWRFQPSTDKLMEVLGNCKVPRNARLYIEHSHAFPGMSRVAAFKMGMSFGSITAWAELCMRRKPVIVPSQVWQKRLGIKPTGAYAEKKRMLIALARSILPDINVNNIPLDACNKFTADAMLIAIYGYMDSQVRLDGEGDLHDED